MFVIESYMSWLILFSFYRQIAPTGFYCLLILCFAYVIGWQFHLFNLSKITFKIL